MQGLSLLTLFMTELFASDPEGLSRWYAEILGLRVVLRDEPNGFILLEAPGGGRLALKRPAAEWTGSPAIRLVFQVDDLEATRNRLIGLGVSAGEPTENAREQYREVRLMDPVGTPITLFAWSNR